MAVAGGLGLRPLADRPAAAVTGVVVVPGQAAGGADVHGDGAVVLEAPLGHVLVPADLVHGVDEEVLADGLVDLVRGVALHAVGVAAGTSGGAQALDGRGLVDGVGDLDRLDGAAGALAGCQVHQALGEVEAGEVVVLDGAVVVGDVDLAEPGAGEDLDRPGFALGPVGDVLQDEAGLAVVAPAHPPGRAGGELLFDAVGGAAVGRGRRGGGLRPGGGRTGAGRGAGGERGHGQGHGRPGAGRAGAVHAHDEVTP